MENLEIDGVIRDLSHLSPFIVAVPGKGHDGAVLRVEVVLGLHAVSKGGVWGQHNMVDENGKPRLFCEDRYAFSLGLPELASRMIADKYFCWQSEDRNRAINFAVIDVAPGRVRQLQAGEHRMVFFYLHPSKKADADVTMVVTSCHSRYFDMSREKRRFDLHQVLRTCLYKGKRVP